MAVEASSQLSTILVSTRTPLCTTTTLHGVDETQFQHKNTHKYKYKYKNTNQYTQTRTYKHAYTHSHYRGIHPLCTATTLHSSWHSTNEGERHHFSTHTHMHTNAYTCIHAHTDNVWLKRKMLSSTAVWYNLLVCTSKLWAAQS